MSRRSIAADQRAVGLLAARHDEQPRRVLVEAMDDARARLVPAADAVLHEPVDERAVLVPGRRMHDDAGRLVDDQQPVVLVDERAVSASGLERCAGRRLRQVVDLVARPAARAACAPASAHAHAAVLDEALRRGAREAGARRQHDVEARAGLVGPAP